MKHIATIGIVILRFHRASFRQFKYVRGLDIMFDLTEETYHAKFYRQRFKLDRNTVMHMLVFELYKILH